ncbi:MAG: trypsin-like peptidase domain-containing protein [Actinomycetes bacterium]
MRTTLSKVVIGFVMGATAAGGVATAAGTFSSPVIKACADNRTGALYASLDGTCAKTRTSVDIGAPTSGSTSIKSTVGKVSPSVVSINVTTASGGDTGSGSIIKSDSSTSLVLTNNHVIDAAATGSGTIAVELDNGDSVPATIVGRDAIYDLAVLKISRGNQPVIAIGDSSAISIGDPVIAFGSPLGLSHTVTSGIVSSLNRPVITGNTGSESFIDAIQTDAAINPGNSGGPLTDSYGRMVGINSAIASLGTGSTSGSIGLGFAIPYNEAQRVINEIIATGTSTRPVLGVSFDQTYTGKGARVAAISSGFGAEKAGLPVGAIITQIDSGKIADYVEAIVRIRSYAPGTTVSVTATLPSGGTKLFSIILGSAPSNG